MDRVRAVSNSVILALILFASALFQSEVGGSDSVYNAVTVGLIVVFIIVNRRVQPVLVTGFALPLILLTLSVAVNLDSLSIGGLRSAGAIAVGYVLLTLSPVPLHHALLRRLVLIYLVAAVTFSLILIVDRQAIDFSQELANANFNVNPNGAALFFVGGILLSLAVVGGTLGWTFWIPLGLLTLTTGSRAGAIMVVLIPLLYAVVENTQPAGASAADRKRFSVLNRLAGKWRMWLALSAAAAMAVWFFPDAVDFLILRFQVGSSRNDRWLPAIQTIESVQRFMFGTGPATLGAATNSASHSSYIEAVGNIGFPFLLATLLALAVWLRRLVNAGARDMLWIVPPVLLYGLVESILFNGISTIWLMMMWLSIVSQSRSAGLDVSAATLARTSVSSATLVPVRRLVVNKRPESRGRPELKRS